MAENRIEVQFAADLQQFAGDLAQAGALLGTTTGEMRDTIAALSQNTARLMADQVQTISAAMRQVSDRQKQEVANNERAWQGMISPMTHAFGSAIQGMVLGTTTFRQAMAKMGQSIVSDFFSVCERIATKWLTTELTRVSASEASAALRAEAENNAASQGIASHGAAALKTVFNDAYKAAASTYASVSEIPVVGWILAPPAAAVAFATVAAYGSGVVSAAGGYVVPQDMLAMVHQREVILPAHIADRFLQASAPGNNGATNVHFNVSAVDGADVARFFKRHGNAIADSLKDVQRNFKPGFARV